MLFVFYEIFWQYLHLNIHIDLTSVEEKFVTFNKQDSNVCETSDR